MQRALVAIARWQFSASAVTMVPRRQGDHAKTAIAAIKAKCDSPGGVAPSPPTL